MTLENQLLNTLLDKGTLALVGAGFLWFLNRNLEKFKASEALANEFSKAKLSKISDIWNVLYKWEADIRKITISVQKSIYFADEKEYPDRLRPFVDSIKEQLENRGLEIIAEITSARYLIGESLYASFLDYSKRLANQLNMLLERPKDASVDSFSKSLEIARDATMRELSLQFQIFQRHR